MRLWLLVLAAVGAAQASDEGFVCPGRYNCSCVFEGPGEYDLTCPEFGETRMSMVIKAARRHAKVQCNQHTVSTDYNLLNDVVIPPVEKLRFSFCPLPDEPFTKLIKLRHPEDIGTLQFDSYRSLNNTLERRHFIGLTGIKRILLVNNGLTALPSDLLMDMPHLTSLDLGNNRVQLPADILQPVLSLQILDLGSNDLTALPQGLLRNMKKLQQLNLWKNKLSLTSDLFSDLSSLTSLDLSNNGLTSLPTDLFKYLTNLKALSLNGNNFRTLPSGLFSYNAQLETVRLFDIRDGGLRLPNRLLANLASLKSVTFYKSGLKEVPEDLFWGSTSLVNISFQSNQLKEIPAKMFQDAKNLEKLQLGNNLLTDLPDNVFSPLKKLQVLDLSYNKLLNISRFMLEGLEKLEELNLRNNALQHVDVNAFQSLGRLRTISLANNYLSFLDKDGFAEGSLHTIDGFGQKSPLHNCFELETLDLFNNSISEIFADWRVTMTSLKTLNISHNELQSLAFPYETFTGNALIDARHNNITAVLIVDGAIETGKRQKWLLEGNPLWCDCSNYQLFRYFEQTISPEVLSIIELVPGDLTCAGPSDMTNQRVQNIPARAVTCPIQSSSLKNGATCPHKCSCHIRPGDRAIIVDCIAGNLTGAPQRLPSSVDLNTTELFLTYKLSIGSGINHTELYLTHNRLHSLPDFTLPGYRNVTKLYVGHNNITSLNFTSLPSLMQVIELDHNNISMIEPSVLSILSNLTNLTSLSLHSNPWVCDCSTQQLVNFIQLRFKQIPKLKDIVCSDGRLLTELTASALCSQYSGIVWMLIIIAALFGIVLGALIALYYRYEREVKVWLFAHRVCLWFVTEEELDKDKLYDAFVSYSHKDEDFVVDKLVAGLEGGSTPFKLCLHYRDWMAGEWIPNNIARSVEESRRTLVVLSPNFLESVWGRMEFRTAHSQALSEGRARVIVVLYGDIGPTQDLDPELRAYLNMNTYVKWGDPWFWDKLRYALPHPPELVKGGTNMGLVNRSNKQINGRALEDKVELICDRNTTTNAVTTPPADDSTTDPLSKVKLNGSLNSPPKVRLPPNGVIGTAAAVS